MYSFLGLESISEFVLFIFLLADKQNARPGNPKHSHRSCVEKVKKRIWLLYIFFLSSEINVWFRWTRAIHIAVNDFFSKSNTSLGTGTVWSVIVTYQKSLTLKRLNETVRFKKELEQKEYSDLSISDAER